MEASEISVLVARESGYFDRTNGGSETLSLKMCHSEWSRMGTTHRVVFGDCRKMKEIPDESIQLMITSPPYFNAPFDYPDLFRDYDEFLSLIYDLSHEVYRVLAPGRVACFVTDDMLVKGEKFPVVADITRLMLEAGFRYRDRIVWVKPKGYVRISRRSGVVIQHPYPMYFYPDNILESILIFQKGKFDYSYVKQLPSKLLEKSRIPLQEYNGNEWHLTVWNITNVLPLGLRLEKGIAAFPEEIPKRLIKLFSFHGETVLDPFLGSGTTMKVAQELGRNSWGYEIDRGLKKIISQKLGNGHRSDSKVEFALRQELRKSRPTVPRKHLTTLSS
jgi:DNA modification methylase